MTALQTTIDAAAPANLGGDRPQAAPMLRGGPGCLCEDLARGVRRHARRLHGGAEHPDRQCVAGRHSGRDRRRHRRRRLDLDLLSDRRDRRDSLERLARAGVLDPHLSPDQRRPVSGVLRRLRIRAGPAADDRAARRPGFHRRRADPDGLHPDHHAAAEGEAADRTCAVRDLRDLCARRSARRSAVTSPRIGAGSTSSMSISCPAR